ncbi:hypothetical protein CERSUDRAFT_96117 [Gelatoporia subvermispora B]|uniref:F-box domain-containing protein n=1 Tax=Ceriporiopsis subvermispora (strain B) TaxID=914234 RepID=M2RBW6_CERS8|nr:hypothetical protein CERSUDRAFT_96117 [Gelatoporia subvermispora B]
MPTSPDVDDTWLGDLIVSWPRLRRLRLICETYIKQNRLTLRAAVLLAEAFPAIRHLSITLNAEVPPHPARQPGQPAQFQSVGILSLKLFAIEHPRDVAAFLHELVPEDTTVVFATSWSPITAADEMTVAFASLRSAQQRRAAPPHTL